MESGADDQERILEVSLVQNWWFIKARGQDPWAERAAAPDCEGWLIIYLGAGGRKDKGRLRKDFHMLKKTQRIRGLAIVKSRPFTPLVRH